MVSIEYVDGSSEAVETKESKLTNFHRSNFCYDKGIQMFIVCTSDKENECMMIPREFVKSIRHIETGREWVNQKENQDHNRQSGISLITIIAIIAKTEIIAINANC